MQREQTCKQDEQENPQQVGPSLIPIIQISISMMLKESFPRPAFQYIPGRKQCRSEYCPCHDGAVSATGESV